jgi:formamidopyrimidine-DNA glycosylase
MPELPDVEIAKRRLHDALSGTKILAASSSDRYVLRPRSPVVFSSTLVGRSIRDIGRRGKWLRIVLDDGTRLFSHLGMTGWWVERDADAPTERSERARIDVARRGRQARSVRYVDARRFGRLIVAKNDIAEWRALGPDPLVEGIRIDTLGKALGRSRRAVKDALMDQSVLAGIGNIVATEALWHARIDPRSASDALSRADLHDVVRGLQKELRRELSVRQRAEGDEWNDRFSVYGRTGQPCPRCGAPLARVIIAGRTTTFCKRCQRLRRSRA